MLRIALLVAALGGTAFADGNVGDACTLNVDLERHGRLTADRWARYSVALPAGKPTVAGIQKAAAKLKANGVPPDAPKAGLAVSEIADGSVTVRSDVDGSLETDR